MNSENNTVLFVTSLIFFVGLGPHVNFSQVFKLVKNNI